jgi:RNA-binding protein
VYRRLSDLSRICSRCVEPSFLYLEKTKILVEFSEPCHYDGAMELKGVHRKYLRGLAHGLKPMVLVGKSGVTPGLLVSVKQALNDHELIKIRFVDHKDSKDEIALRIAGGTECDLVGMIGNVAIFYRRHTDPSKRKIVMPKVGHEEAQEEP